MHIFTCSAITEKCHKKKNRTYVKLHKIIGNKTYFYSKNCKLEIYRKTGNPSIDHQNFFSKFLNFHYRLSWTLR